jgi:hypothetical protein
MLNLSAVGTCTSPNVSIGWYACVNAVYVHRSLLKNGFYIFLPHFYRQSARILDKKRRASEVFSDARD